MLLDGRLPRLGVWWRAGGIVAGLTCWLVAVAAFDVKSWDPHPTVAGAILGWLLVLAGTILFFLSTLGIAARRIPTWLAHLGRISYGLYVFHSLLFFLVFGKGVAALRLDAGSWWVDIPATVLTFAITAASAQLSYRWFETPFLRWKGRFAALPTRNRALG